MTAEPPATGAQLPAAPGPVADAYWTGGGCGHMALAFRTLWPDLKIGAEIDNKQGTVNHAWVHDGTRAHDGAGTHDDPAAWSPNWPNSTVDMDVSPQRLATLMGINWSEQDPWADANVYEAAELIEKHWLRTR